MTSNKLTEEPLKRRRFMKTAVGLTLAPIAIGLWGCGGSNSASDSSTTSNSSSSNNDTDSNAEPEEDFDGWASGGTSAMTSDFPDDSLFDSASVCSIALTGSQTEGPCYFQSDYLDDISYEQTGLPMMLCLQLIDEACNPLSGYEIEVWHCGDRC